MEQNMSDAEIAKDVLHNEDHSRLSQEEVAKALAHHNKRHKDDGSQQSAQMKGQAGRKNAPAKPK